MTSDRAGQPWRARQREILSRIVRETEAPTDSLPLIKHPERRQPDDYYDARLGEVLDLAVSVGAVLMASGTPATAVTNQVAAIAAAYGIEHCEVDVINTAIHVAVYRGPTLPPAGTLHIVQSRSMDFSRLAAVDRWSVASARSRYRRRTPTTSLTRSSPRRTPISAGSPPWPGGRWRSLRRGPWAGTFWSAWSAR